MNIQTELNSVVDIIFRLPTIINHKGYQFTLSFFEDEKGQQVGYIMTGVTVRNKKKREAFKNGFWFDGNDKHVFYTNFLTLRFFWSEIGLLRELMSIEQELNAKHIINTLNHVSYNN